MAPTQLFLLRHGEVESRYHRVFGGRIDMDLSPQGHLQAAALATYLKGKVLDAIYCSPMKRAQQTLAPLLDHHNLEPTTLQDLWGKCHLMLVRGSVKMEVSSDVGQVG